jgi:uncharacterized membrane protein YadS
MKSIGTMRTICLINELCAKILGLESRWSQPVTLVPTSRTAVTLTQKDAARLTSAAPRWCGRSAREILPGLLLASALTAASFVIRTLPGTTTFSPQMLWMVIGIAYHNIVGTTVSAKRSVTLGIRRRLGIAIARLGVRLPSSRVFEVGSRHLGIIAATAVATFAVSETRALIIAATTPMMALAAMGLGSDIGSMPTIGHRPVLPVAFACSFIAAFSFTLTTG